jgi:hypothetical protein
MCLCVITTYSSFHYLTSKRDIHTKTLKQVHTLLSGFEASACLARRYVDNSYKSPFKAAPSRGELRNGTQKAYLHSFCFCGP